MPSAMFTPVKIGSCEIPNRFAVTAMVVNLCTETGDATTRYVKYHEARARGGYGLIITEDYRINRHANGYKYVAGLYTEQQIPGHRALTNAVHRYGAKIFCQIYHAGRQASSTVNGGAPIVAPSPTSSPWNREVARELTVEEIHELVCDFGRSAKNAKAAGFDGIEIHAGNGYLIAEFLSFHSNKRTDEYGGCFLNRMRFFTEVYQAVRAAVGEDFPIMVRFSADEHTLSGRSLEESKLVARYMESLGVDALNCSNGIYGTYNPGQVSPSFQPHAWTIENAKALKNCVNIPVLGCNSIDDPLMAEMLIETGCCDLVGMARCALADPDMPRKFRDGQPERIRPCIRCMQGCVSSTYLQIPIRCCVNPEVGKEYLYTYEDKPEEKRVLIIGGGPGGMEAAIAAARRGHSVTLWEKTDRLGGQFIAASYPPGKGEHITFLCYLINELKVLKVHTVLNREATAEDVLAFGADRVILATGGVPNRPQIPSIDRKNVYYAEEVLRGRILPEGRIVIAGGGENGVETAMHLADAERGELTIVARSGLASKADGTIKVAMMRFLKEREVRVLTHTKILEICESGILLERNGQVQVLPCDHVVIAMGYRPNNTLHSQLEAVLGNRLTVIGDAAECTNAMNAADQGFKAGYYA